MKVIPFQCLGCVWSQRDKKENLSPTIWATIAQFNAVTNRVITSLLCPSSNLVPPLSPASANTYRARVIEKWVEVAQVSLVYDGVLYFFYIKQSSIISSHLGLQGAKELLLAQGHFVGPSIQRHLQAEEDLGRREQVQINSTDGKLRDDQEEELILCKSLSRETTSVFENLCETFPDENCVLTSREIFVDVSNLVFRINL